MHIKRFLAGLAALSVSATACGRPLPPVAEPPIAAPVTPVAIDTGRVQMLWDTWGIPHVFAQDAAAMAYAFGWAQMRAHRDLLLHLYAQARGRSAEIDGESGVASDTWVLTNDIPERAAAWLAEQRPQERAILDAFAAGINAYATAHSDSIDASLRTVLPVSAADVLAHMQHVINFTFLTDQSVLSGVRTWSQGGSNGWAIAPRRSASRDPMILSNPHLPWGGAFTMFEAELSTPEVDAYGATFVGFPLLSIAFNDSIAWTSTVNTIDGADLYGLKLSGNGYMYDGAVRQFETKQKTLRVKQTDGSIATRPLPVVSSVHGPVIARRNGGALALRVAGLDAPHIVQQSWEMMTSHNMYDFEHALSRLQIPMFTMLFADHRGNILDVFNGRVPQRSHGDAAYWRGVVPGDSSSTLWTDVIPYDRLPRLANPATGFLQNANEPPWTATIPVSIDPSRFPPWVAPPPSMSFRAIRSARMLAEDSSITFDDLVAAKHSTRVEEADHILEDVVIAARKSGDAPARAAADVLEKWDRSTDADSRGAVLFIEFARAFNERAASGFRMFDVPWTLKAPLATPDGIADAATAVHMLDAAAERVRARYGRIDVSWGETHRLVRDAVDLPANAGPGDVGVFRTLMFDSVSPTRSIASGGDSWVAAIELANPVRAHALLSYGNWSQPGSPHRTDQLPLFASKQLRPVWRTRAEIEKHVEAREVF